MARVPPQYRHISQSTWLCVCNNIQTVHGIPTGLASQTDSPMATAMRAIACHKDSEGASSALCPSVYCPAEYTVHAALQHGHLYSLEWSGVEFCLIETVPFKHLYTDNKYHQSYEGSSLGLPKSCFLGSLRYLLLSSRRSKVTMHIKF